MHTFVQLYNVFTFHDSLSQFIDTLTCLVVLLALQIAAYAALGGLEERRVVREAIIIDALGVGTAGCVVIEGDGAPAAVLWARQRRRVSVVAEVC